MRVTSRIVHSIIAATAVAVAAPVLADPPGHAPAHGYRAKQKHREEVRFVSLSGVEWDLDFGITSGNCDRRAIGTALGGITGAVIANRVADENRDVATLIGAAAGALIGRRIGRSIDKADEACIGHALELGDSGRPVNWVNEETGVSYQVVPGPSRTRNGADCREFSFTAVAGSERSSRQGLGCQSGPGVWEFVQ